MAIMAIMALAPSPAMRYFLPFRFDDESAALWRNGQRVALTPKAAGVLACLLNDAGAWVGRDTIMRAVWPATHVEPDNVKVLVRELRVALGDDARQPKFIRTEPKRGYMFAAPVLEHTAAADGGRDTDRSWFVSRSSELAELAGQYDAAVLGHPRFVWVVGERGVGKSVLCVRFVHYANALAPSRTAIVPGVDRRAGGSPLAPVFDALQVLDHQWPDIVRPLLQATPALRDLFEGRGGVRSDRASAAAAGQLGVVLAALTTERPLVLVFEDLDRADPVAQVGLPRLVERMPAGRLLVVGTACGFAPEAVGAGSRRSGGVRNHTILLRPLSEDDIRQTLAVRFGSGELASLAPGLNVASGGNLALLTTAVNGVISRGLIRREADGAWRASGSVSAIEDALPGIVSDALQWRLERLNRLDISLLTGASRQQAEFTAEGVAAAVGHAAGVVRGRLDRLASVEGLITRVVGTAPRGPARYRFRFAQQRERLRTAGGRRPQVADAIERRRA